MEVSGQLHAPAALPPGERAPGTPCIGGWVGPRAGLDDMEKRKIFPLPGLELRPLGRSARSQSLYWLSSQKEEYKSGKEENIEEEGEKRDLKRRLKGKR
jgi:hypothetical protein